MNKSKNLNFNEAVKAADKNGTAVVYQDGNPKYLLVNLPGEGYIELTDDEKIDVVSRRLLNKHKKAYLELAK